MVMVADVFAVLVHIFLFIALYFEVFLLFSFFEQRHRLNEHAQEPEELPTATIFVPCYNEEKTVEKTLESLLDLDYPKDKLTIFAVDDGSRDRTWEVLQRFVNHPQVRIFHKKNGGKHTALNLGLEHATSELVGVLDADSFVDRNALRAIVRRFADASVMAVTPAIKVIGPRNFIQKIQHAEYALSSCIRRTFSWLDAIFITPGPFSIFRREVFLKLGPYHEAHNTEDMEVALRMQSNNMRIENAPDAHIFTNAPRTYKTLFKQRVRWSYGFLKNAQDYRHLFFNRRYGDLGMFILPLGLFTILPAIYFTMLMLVSASQNLIQEITRVQIVGFHPRFWEGGFDWFYFNTQSIVFLTILLVSCTVAIIAIGKRLTNERGLFSGDVLLYLLLYGIMSPWWLLKALSDVTFGRKVSWATEIEQRRRDDA